MLDGSTIYLHHCFTLPNINELTKNELQAVHHSLNEAGSAFRQNVDEWIDMCYFENDLPQRLAFFSSHVLPSANELQQLIAGNDTLLLCSRQPHQVTTIEVWIGEMPVEALWNYYRYFEALHNDTWSKLQQVKDDEEFAGKRWPVFMLNVPALHEQPADNNADMKPTRKYISID